MRVATYNVRNGRSDQDENRWSLRAPTFVAMLRSLDADLIGLQEPFAFQLEDILAACPEYQAVGVGREDGDREGEFCPILYRSSLFELIESGTFWLSDTPEIPGSSTWGNRVVRICTWAQFTRLGDRSEFLHFNVHLDHESDLSRLRSADLLLSRMPDDAPVILTGDFNVGESDEVIQRFTAKWIDAVRAINPDGPEIGTFNGFQPDFGPERIDYIFVSPNIRVQSANIRREHLNGIWPSDHAPIVASIEL
jgi:endonuclease/exonuclease/phosphatase family metal-dependent hydrolase